ncbi:MULTISPECIES: L-serine ammonia-lyase, iron-sulfur-dependent, subunit alpha [unclassified Pseudomonas]|uniref:L-serine ammonia-lyase, iron-sulfur-dependent, subunit alpha n=1 Tax=unclassified Pseudomonas TaxID=196821 RepID=UPI001C4987A2|nr:MULTISPECIES: L-serine ammonia-lyase, iron-sulfur-dependent, subunit alpha [unclassified Pseudomonas]
MNNKSQRRTKSNVITYVACFFETVWAAMVSVMAASTSGVQGILSLAKNIISLR